MAFGSNNDAGDLGIGDFVGTSQTNSFADFGIDNSFTAQAMMAGVGFLNDLTGTTGAPNTFNTGFNESSGGTFGPGGSQPFIAANAGIGGATVPAALSLKASQGAPAAKRAIQLLQSNPLAANVPAVKAILDQINSQGTEFFRGPDEQLLAPLISALQSAPTFSLGPQGLTVNGIPAAGGAPGAPGTSPSGTALGFPTGATNFGPEDFDFANLEQFAFPSEISLKTPTGSVDISQGDGVFDAVFNRGSQATDLFNQRASQFENLATTLEQRAAVFDTGPLRKAIGDTFTSARERLGLREKATISDIDADFSRNRLSGSSFERDAKNQAAAEFEVARNELNAQESLQVSQARLTEIAEQTKLLTGAAQTRVTAVKEQITQLFGETEVAIGLSSTFAQLIDSNLKAQLAVFASEAQSIRDNQTRLLAGREANQATIEAARVSGQFQSRIAGQQLEAQGISGLGNLAGNLLTSGSDSVFGKILGKIPGFG